MLMVTSLLNINASSCQTLHCAFMGELCEEIYPSSILRLYVENRPARYTGMGSAASSLQASESSGLPTAFPDTYRNRDELPGLQILKSSNKLSRRGVWQRGTAFNPGWIWKER